jgi:hypothetical protein
MLSTLLPDLSFGAFGALLASAATGQHAVCLALAVALTLAGFLTRETEA